MAPLGISRGSLFRHKPNQHGQNDNPRLRWYHIYAILSRISLRLLVPNSGLLLLQKQGAHTESPHNSPPLPSRRTKRKTPIAGFEPATYNFVKLKKIVAVDFYSRDDRSRPST